ncbi:MAG: hypothetical protein K2Q21_04385 [Chitinophagaceae bacterium]|nr:hypothetical protein [Chitinophagaceae bacterium]
MNKQSVYSVICLFVMFILFSGYILPQKKIKLQFHHFAGAKPLVLGDTIVNPFGEKLVVERFKYYLSNFILTDLSGKKESIPNSYFLVDEADSASKTIELNTSLKKIIAIEFMIGIDSIKNCSGIQTGVLDPMKAMFWTWNTGYVFAKLEGQSSASKSAAHRFTYHVGGFKEGENAIKKIRLALTEQNQPIHVSADINSWFNSRHPIKISESPVCHAPGPLALQLADNYSNMFSILPK